MLDLIINTIQESPLILVKIALLIVLLLYITFGIIVYRQTQTMTKLIDASASKTVELIAFIHLLAIIFLFLWTLINL